MSKFPLAAKIVLSNILPNYSTRLEKPLPKGNQLGYNLQDKRQNKLGKR